MLRKLNKLFQKICKLWSKPILSRKGSKYGKTKSIHSYSLWLLYLNAYWYLSKHCRLTIFSWASVPILDILDQQEKFTTYVTKLNLAANATFICKILCFEVFKILSVNWLTGCLKIKAFTNVKLPRTPLPGECASGAYFWPCQLKMVPYRLS